MFISKPHLGRDDVRDESTGAYKAHPKVYVGFFKHPNFPNRDTHLLTLDLTPAQRGSEYRSNDWYYIPRPEDLQPGSVIGVFPPRRRGVRLIFDIS
jgi:hypothetical protein